jgi:hypothetical protein
MSSISGAALSLTAQAPARSRVILEDPARVAGQDFKIKS